MPPMMQQPIQPNMQQGQASSPQIAVIQRIAQDFQQIQQMLQQMLSSKDTRMLPQLAQKIHELDMMAQQIAGGMNESEYMKKSPEEKDKIDEEQVMGRQ